MQCWSVFFIYAPLRCKSSILKRMDYIEPEQEQRPGAGAMVFKSDPRPNDLHATPRSTLPSENGMYM